jgi:hypothetical protein
MFIFKKLGETNSELGNEMLVALRRYVVAHEVLTELLHTPYR